MKKHFIPFLFSTFSLLGVDSTANSAATYNAAITASTTATNTINITGDFTMNTPATAVQNQITLFENTTTKTITGGNNSIVNITTAGTELILANGIVTAGTMSDTTISGGTLQVNADGNSTALGTIPLSNGGTFEVNYTPASISNVFNIAASNGTILVDAGNSAAFANFQVLTGGVLTLSTAAGSTASFSASSGGGGGITKIGSGSLLFSASNGYTGPTTISGGTLSLVAPAALLNSQVIDNSVFDISGVGSSAQIKDLAGTGSVILGINKTLAFINAASTFSGIISDITGGALILQAGTLTLSNVNTYHGTTAISSGATFALSGSGSIANSSSVMATGTFDISGVTTSTPIIGLSGAGSVNLGGKTLTLTGNTSFSGVISGTGGGLTISGTANLGGINTYTGTTSIQNGGLILLSNSGSIATSGQIMANGTFAITSISGSSTSIIDLTGSGLVNLGTSKTLVLTNPTSTFAGTIEDTSGGSLTKLGTGTFTLSGSNAYQGTTSINGGTLSISADSNLGNPAATVSFGGGALNTTSSFATARTLTGAASFNVNTATTFTMNSSIANLSGMTSLTMATGSGTLALNNQANTFTGNISLNAGTLSIAADNNLGNAANTLSFNGGTLGTTLTTSTARAITLSGAGTFDVAPSTTFTMSSNITGGGSLTKTDTGTLILSGLNAYSGATTISGGTLALTGTGSIASSSQVADNGTFDISGATGGVSLITLSGNGAVVLGGNTLTLSNASTTFSGALSGTGGVTVSAGTFTLSGSNGYSGTTTISGGATLDLTGSGTIATSIVADSGAFSISGASGGITIPSLSGNGTVALGANTLTLSNASTTFLGGISGTGGVTISAGTFTLSGTNGYTGTTTINSGATLDLTGSGSIANSIVADNGAFNISGASGGISIPSLSGNGTVALGGNTLTLSNASTTFSGALSGTGGVTVSAGTFTLSGTNGYTGTTTVNSGRLNVNGSITSNTIVNSGGVLGGSNGTITGNVTVNNGGTLSPGNSIGTLMINGNLTLNPSSTTSIELDPTHTSLIDGSGTANIDGSLVVVADPGVYSPNQIYTILQAGSVTGTFTNATVTSGAMTFNIQYFPTMIQLMLGTISRFNIPTSGLTGNSAILANYLNHLPTNLLSGPLGSYLATLAGLSTTQLNQALETISTSRNSFTTFTAQNIAFSLTDLIASSLDDRRATRARKQKHSSLASGTWKDQLLVLNKDETVSPNIRKVESGASFDKRFSLWGGGFGGFTQQDAQNQNPAFHANSQIGIVGFDGNFQNGLVGVAAAYAHTSLDQEQSFGNGSVHQVLGSLYSEFYISDFYLDLSFWVGYNQFHNQRHLFFPGFDANASSQHSGMQYVPHGVVGYDFTIDWFTIEPFFALDWAFSQENGYSEKGAALFDMIQKSHHSSMSRINTGINFYQTIDQDTNIWLVRESISYIHKKPYGVGTLTSALLGAPTFFTVESFTESQNLFSPAVEIYWGSEKGYYLSLNYEGEFGSGYVSNQIYGKVGLHF